MNNENLRKWRKGRGPTPFSAREVEWKEIGGPEKKTETVDGGEGTVNKTRREKQSKYE